MQKRKTLGKKEESPKGKSLIPEDISPLEEEPENYPQPEKVTVLDKTESPDIGLSDLFYEVPEPSQTISEKEETQKEKEDKTKILSKLPKLEPKYEFYSIKNYVPGYVVVTKDYLTSTHFLPEKLKLSLYDQVLEMEKDGWKPIDIANAIQKNIKGRIEKEILQKPLDLPEDFQESPQEIVKHQFIYKNLNFESLPEYVKRTVTGNGKYVEERYYLPDYMKERFDEELYSTMKKIEKKEGSFKHENIEKIKMAFRNRLKNEITKNILEKTLYLDTDPKYSFFYKGESQYDNLIPYKITVRAPPLSTKKISFNYTIEKNSDTYIYFVDMITKYQRQYFDLYGFDEKKKADLLRKKIDYYNEKLKQIDLKRDRIQNVSFFEKEYLPRDKILKKTQEQRESIVKKAYDRFQNLKSKSEKDNFRKRMKKIKKQYEEAEKKLIEDLYKKYLEDTSRSLEEEQKKIVQDKEKFLLERRKSSAKESKYDENRLRKNIQNEIKLLTKTKQLYKVIPKRKITYTDEDYKKYFPEKSHNVDVYYKKYEKYDPKNVLYKDQNIEKLANIELAEESEYSESEETLPDIKVRPAKIIPDIYPGDLFRETDLDWDLEIGSWVDNIIYVWTISDEGNWKTGRRLYLIPSSYDGDGYSTKFMEKIKYSCGDTVLNYFDYIIVDASRGENILTYLENLESVYDLRICGESVYLPRMKFTLNDIYDYLSISKNFLMNYFRNMNVVRPNRLSRYYGVMPVEPKIDTPMIYTEKYPDYFINFYKNNLRKNGNIDIIEKDQPTNNFVDFFHQIYAVYNRSLKKFDDIIFPTYDYKFSDSATLLLYPLFLRDVTKDTSGNYQYLDHHHSLLLLEQQIGKVDVYVFDPLGKYKFDLYRDVYNFIIRSILPDDIPYDFHDGSEFNITMHDSFATVGYIEKLQLGITDQDNTSVDRSKASTDAMKWIFWFIDYLFFNYDRNSRAKYMTSSAEIYVSKFGKEKIYFQDYIEKYIYYKTKID